MKFNKEKFFISILSAIIGGIACSIATIFLMPDSKNCPDQNINITPNFNITLFNPEERKNEENFSQKEFGNWFIINDLSGIEDPSFQYRCIKKGDIKSLNAFLDFLINTLEDAREINNKNIENILNEIKTISTIINFRGPITLDIPIHHFLKHIIDFPLTHYVFNVSINDIAWMNQNIVTG